MHITWRVVAIDTNGARVVVDEGLSHDGALATADAMLKKGHDVNIEADRSHHPRMPRMSDN